MLNKRIYGFILVFALLAQTAFSAINPSTSTEYAGQVAAPTAAYPYGSARNDATPGDLTGTPRVATEINDTFGFHQKLLDYAGIVPSGTPDNVITSQYFDALLATIRTRAVPSLAALQGTEPEVEEDTRYVLGRSTTGDGYQGTFVWSTADLSAEVTADTLSGIYVAPTSDPTGASGAWVRQYTGALNALWFGADSSGIADFYPVLIAILGIMQYGDTLYIPAGSYLDTTGHRNAVLPSGITILGAGKGKTVFDGGLRLRATNKSNITLRDFGWSNTGDNIIMIDCFDMEIDSLKFDQLTSAASPDGVRLIGCDKVTVNRCDFYNASYAVITAQEGSANNNSNIDITKCYFFCNDVLHTYPAGVFIVTGIGVRIENNYFEFSAAGYAGYAIYQGDNSIGIARNISIIGNTFKDSHWADIRLKKCEQVTISGNTSSGNTVFAYLEGLHPLNGITGTDYLRDISIVGNNTKGLSGVLALYRVRNVTIVGNTFREGTRGIRLWGVDTLGDSEGCVISNNIIHTMSGGGIVLRYAKSVLVSNNTIYDVNTGAAPAGVGSDNAAIGLYATNDNIKIINNYAENTPDSSGAAHYFLNGGNFAAITDVEAKDNKAKGMLTAFSREYGQYELTISDGSITPPRAGAFNIDTEGDAATDDLHTIDASNLVPGDTITLRTVAGARDVVLKNETGNLYLNADITLSSNTSTISLLWMGTAFVKLSSFID